MLGLVRAERERFGRSPEVEALVQRVIVTEDRAHALAELSEQLPGTTPDELDQTPFLLIGTIAQMAEQLTRQAEQLGITRYVVREPALDAAEQILDRLRA
jgi:alkanesulfonate monooxygenase SsuD/methylene tetrahydromethanopterin reductase-like flavin-dependent oxidoreductase (luciferase family)